MVRIMAALGLALLFAAQGAFAEEAGDPLSQAMQRNPARFETRMIDLIAGFGGPDGLTLAGIDEHVAVERAGARAAALRRMLAMDLDGDGGVTRAELAVAQRASSAKARGRMERQFVGADRDSDGRIDPAEMAAEGQAAALAALDADAAALLRATLRLDADGNGALSAQEVRAALARLEQEV